jgi:hypothetical protein
MKIAARTKVALYTSFSRPLRVKEAEPLDDLAKPVPLLCTRITIIKNKAEKSCTKSSI